MSHSTPHFDPKKLFSQTASYYDTQAHRETTVWAILNKGFL